VAAEREVGVAVRAPSEAQPASATTDMRPAAHTRARERSIENRLTGLVLEHGPIECSECDGTEVVTADQIATDAN
jgi:hypothetical protein